MPSAKIYHNPRCSKSRNSLQILLDHQFEVEEVRYLETPPSKEELTELCQLMHTTPLEIMRTGESLFKELGLSKHDQRSDDEWFEILVNNPKLIERPIVKIGGRAIMGRPPENVLHLIQSIQH
ncbi:MAG: arsenate reductase (glutaredoxin) [Thiomicrorhabdus chilensis]|uniref:arsenate reductase (glutaredoxin) n=1 Tax=Thiomicrorhabdus chilensis TaxID=63656 RepID=UPI00299CF578|nr:arsenate reductase (glutaredoxin) [Thiomicrorhabdus chilensis]MDX1348183.1 arsenate reductase (glutaredoxin) [Thiomicrorhabdus chilensis]